MSAPKLTDEPRKRSSGPTQPEDERRAGQVLLRLRPSVTRSLDALARRWGVSRSEVVARLVSDARDVPREEKT